jgi:hypothetical protein
MNYNYEINYNIRKKKQDPSKYTYKNNEIDSQTFIFELVLKDKFNQHSVFRRIKKCNQGNLISPDDNISYKMIEKYKLTVLDANDPVKPIIVKDNIDHTLSTNTFLNNDIYLEITQSVNNLMDLNYHINLNQ